MSKILYSIPTSNTLALDSHTFADIHAETKRKQTIFRNISRSTRVYFTWDSSFDYITTLLAIVAEQSIAIPANPIINENHETVDAVFTKNKLTVKKNPTQHFFADIILFTSGSTNEPKAIYLSENNLLYNAKTIYTLLDPDVRLQSLVTSNLYYILGLSTQLLMPLVNKGRVISAQNKAFSTLPQEMKKHDINFIAGVPLFYKKLLKESTDRAPIKYAIIGGASWNSELIKEVFERFAVRPASTYGLTETSPILAFSNRHKKQFVGNVIPGSKIEIVSGEIYVSGPGVAKYIQIGTEIEKIDGWYPTGDLGKLQGTEVYYIGRKKELINKGGIKISPSIVEMHFLRLPGVEDCVAGPVFSKAYGEDIGIIYTGKLQSAKTLATLPRHYRPKISICRKQLPTLSASKKVDRKQIRQTLRKIQQE